MFDRLKSRLQKHRGTLLYTLSNMVLAGATFVGSFLAARLLDPSELGAFQTAMLLVTYLGFLPLGIFNGFNREYPYLLGKGDQEDARQLAQTGYSVARVAAGAAMAVAVAQWLIFRHTSNNPVLWLAGLAVIPIAAWNQLNNLQRSILTGRQDFGWIARTQFAGAFVTLAFLIAVWKLGPWGQAIRLVAIATVAWILFLPRTKEARVWRWDWSRIGRLVKIGIPILIIGYFYQVFSVADRTLVAWVKGTEAVGHYALAGLAIAAVQSIYLPLAVATYSKANHVYGRTHSVASLIPSVIKFLILVTVTVVPLAVLVYFLLPITVRWLLPDYVPGIKAGQIACIASVAFCYCGTSFVFNVTGHNRGYALFWVLAVGLFFFIGLRIPAADMTLEEVAWLRTAMSVGVCLLTNLYLLLYIRTRMKLE